MAACLGQLASSRIGGLLRRHVAEFFGLLLPARAGLRMSRGCGAIAPLNFRHFRSQAAGTLTLRNIAASPFLSIPAVGWRFLRQGATIASCRALTGSQTAIIWVRAKVIAEARMNQVSSSRRP